MDLADEDHVGTGTLRRRRDQPLRQAGERLGRHDGELDQSVFCQPLDLAAEGMEFGIAGQDARLAFARQAGEQPVDEFMGVVSRNEPVDPGQIQVLGHALRDLLPDRAEHFLPFAVDEAGGIVPGA